MKSKDFYIKEAERKKEQVISIRSKEPDFTSEEILNPYSEIRNVVIEFAHLVYSYDKSLPLNSYIHELKDIKFSSPFGSYSEYNDREFDNIIYHIDFFIKYLNDYID
ncbi:hypothetical protein [Proteiniphilum sp. X52]|uniref:hypothetical protein n=1 Tax=Proteiniphilum sp. X52 TaxID=2382159 RepID=UPI000F09D2BC|nr:hypothetical protein [Proteiniphilum sp. X52]RNC66454.1 hypothetical protein D7D25_02960 [Proteiniphilum sp. X52]